MSMKRYTSMMWIACSGILGCFAVGCGAESPAEAPSAATSAIQEPASLVGLPETGALAQTEVSVTATGAGDVAPSPPRHAHVMSAEHAAEVHPYAEMPRRPDTATMTIHSSQP
jgi:hypothetical protein